MQIIITKRADGRVCLNTYMSRHHETGLHYAEDEIVSIVTVEVPEAYELEGGGHGYMDEDGNCRSIQDHPEIWGAMQRI